MPAQDQFLGAQQFNKNVPFPKSHALHFAPKGRRPHAGGIIYGMISPAADPGTYSHPTFGNAGGSASGAVVVGQGQTVVIPWQCVQISSVTGLPIGPCPSSYTTYFFPAYEPAAFVGVDFNPNTVTGGNLGIEFFTSSNTAQPGVYGVYGCAETTDEYGYTVGYGCTGFDIQIVAQNVSVPTPPPGLGITPKLQIGPAGLGNVIFPGQGHLYVVNYIGKSKVPFGKLLQAGCDTPGTDNIAEKIAACTSGVGSLLKFEDFTQLGLLTDPSVDISSQTDALTLIEREHKYESMGINVPGYKANSMNSNSWAYGLLLASGVPSPVADTWIKTLMTKSGKSPTAYENGTKLLACFGVGVGVGYNAEVLCAQADNATTRKHSVKSTR